MIIDFHTHVFPKYFRERRSSFFALEPEFGSLYSSSKARLAGVQELLEQMDVDGVDRSVIFGFPWRKPEHFRRHNDYVMDSVQRFPKRLIGFCCFYPLVRGGPLEAERCLEGGLSGIGELGLYESDLSEERISAFGEILALCSRYQAPLLLHTNEPVGHEYPGKTSMTLRQIYRFLRAYPSNRIVLAHWGGGLFFYGLMKREIKETLKNVWFDTAASPFLYHPAVYRLAEELVGTEKILLGTDYPLLPPSRYFEEMNSSGLSSKSIRKIAGTNAARLLGICE